MVVVLVGKPEVLRESCVEGLAVGTEDRALVWAGSAPVVAKFDVVPAAMV